MMFFNRFKSVRSVAAFGAAVASIYVIPEIQAEELDLTFLPPSIPVNTNYPQDVAIEELGLEFLQWNDHIGKTFFAQSLTSVNLVEVGQTISPSTFFGTFTLNFAASDSSDAYVGFRSAGYVGWFKIDLGGLGGDVSYEEGIFGSEGESVVVGGSSFELGDVNCDGAVDLLDVQPFIDLLSSGEYHSKADMDQNGSVDLLDVEPFVDKLTD